MKTIKIIDLLNKIAKGEEVPKKIKIEGIKYSIVNEGYPHTYKDINGYEIEDNSSKYIIDSLNDEVEIIEEVEEDKFEDIEKTKSYEDFEGIDDYIEHLKSKTNELIKNQKKIIEQLKNKD